MKKKPIERNLLSAIDCVKDAYQDHIGHLQGEELKSIPSLKRERDEIIKSIESARLLIMDLKNILL